MWNGISSFCLPKIKIEKRIAKQKGKRKENEGGNKCFLCGNITCGRLDNGFSSDVWGVITHTENESRKTS